MQRGKREVSSKAESWILSILNNQPGHEPDVYWFSREKVITQATTYADGTQAPLSFLPG